MKKIELEIVALSHSESQKSFYAVILGEVNGLRRLPIVIGAFEAQAIAVALERIEPARPLTHDLFATFMGAFSIYLNEVLIYRLEEGIFYAKLVCTNGDETIEIDSRTSDALALAVRAGCPVYCYDGILASAGLQIEEGEVESRNTKMDEQVEDPFEATSATSRDLKQMSKEDLETLLQTVLDQEDYVRAIKIRDELKRRG